MVQKPNGFSICTVFYDEGERMAETLSGVHASYLNFISEFASPVEMIFVNNSGEIKQSTFVEQLAKNSSLSVRIFENSSNNIASARNIGLKHAKYDALIYLDADCKPHSHWLKNMKLASESYWGKDFGAVGGENIPARHFEDVVSRCVRNLKMFPALHLCSTQVAQAALHKKVNHVPTCNVLYSRAALDECGGFLESLSKVGEDLELNMRLSRNGKKIYFSDQLLVEHFDFRSFYEWFLKVFKYGTVQPYVIFKHPFQVGWGRWAPIFTILVILVGLSFSFLPSLGILLLSSLVVPFLTIKEKRSLSFFLQWSYFINGTVFSYLLGYVYGICKTVASFLKLKGA